LSAFSVQPARKRGRNTTAGVLEGFAPWGLRKGGGLPLPTPCPLFVNSVDLRVGRGTRTTSAEQIFDLRFCGFRVGAGEGTTCIQSNRFFMISVFLCDFCVFRVMAGWTRNADDLSRARQMPCGDTVIKKNPLHEIEVHPKNLA
jgi:hypothetical protein